MSKCGSCKLGHLPTAPSRLWVARLSCQQVLKERETVATGGCRSGEGSPRVTSVAPTCVLVRPSHPARSLIGASRSLSDCPHTLLHASGTSSPPTPARSPPTGRKGHGCTLLMTKAHPPPFEVPSLAPCQSQLNEQMCAIDFQFGLLIRQSAAVTGLVTRYHHSGRAFGWRFGEGGGGCKAAEEQPVNTIRVTTSMCDGRRW